MIGPGREQGHSVGEEQKKATRKVARSAITAIPRTGVPVFPVLDPITGSSIFATVAVMDEPSRNGSGDRVVVEIFPQSLKARLVVKTTEPCS